MQADSVAAENVITFLKKHDPRYANTVRVKYDTLRRRMVRAEETQSYGDQNFASSISDVVAILTHMQGANYIKTASQKEIDRAIQNANIVLQAAQNTLTDLYYSPSYRDSCMATNIAWIKDHTSPNAKLILWAHNGHISKLESWTMGSYLDNMFGNKYRAFGFKFHEGAYTAWADGSIKSSNLAIPSWPGTLDWIFHSLHMPHFILDLQKASTTDSRSSWLHQQLETKVISAMANDEYGVGKVADEFDAIIFFDKTTASELLD